MDQMILNVKTAETDTHSFSVNGVHSKQQGSNQAGSPILEHAAHSKKEDAHAGMKDNVEEVVGGCAQLTKEVVQSESENRERPVRFMAPFLCGEEKNDVNSTKYLLMSEEANKLSTTIVLLSKT